RTVPHEVYGSSLCLISEFPLVHHKDGDTGTTHEAKHPDLPPYLPSGENDEYPASIQHSPDSLSEAHQRFLQGHEHLQLEQIPVQSLIHMVWQVHKVHRIAL